METILSTPKSMGWFQSIIYGGLLTFVFFVMVSANIFNLEESNFTDKIVQNTVNLIQSPHYPHPDRSVNLPTVVLFSDFSVALNRYKWPVSMIDLRDLLEDFSLHEPKSIFINITIRSAEHDKGGFCELIQWLATNAKDTLNSSVINQIDSDIEARRTKLINNPDCFDNIDALVSYQIFERKYQRADEIDFSQNEKLPIIFAAPLDYLNAKENFFSLKNKGGLGCIRKDISNLENLENPETPCEKTAFSAIKNLIAATKAWPGIAYLDQVAILAPIAIANDGGKSTNIWVDKLDHFSPAYIQACTGTKKTDHRIQCNRKEDKRFSTDDLYLLWRTGSSIWQKDSFPETSLHHLSYYSKCTDNSDDSLLQFFQSILFSTNCPPYPTIDLALYASGETNIIDIREFVANKNIILGTDLYRFKDNVDSPIQGTIAGAYSHATALDNLLQEKEYIGASSGSKTGRSVTEALDIVKYSVLFLTITALLRFKSVFFTKIDRYSEQLAGTLLLVIFLISCLLLDHKVVIEKISEHRLLFGVIMLFAIWVYLAYLIGNNPAKLPPIRLPGNNFPDIRPSIILARKGTIQLFSHLAVLLFVYLLFSCVSLLISCCFEISPPDLVQAFFFSSPIYFMAARNDLCEGLANLLGNHALAETILDS